MSEKDTTPFAIWCLPVGLVGFGGVKVGLLDVLEVAVGLDLELGAGVFVADDDGVPVHLQGADGPHLRDAAFYAVTQGAGLVVAVDDEHDLLGGHDSADTDGEGGLGNEVDVVLEEARVGDDGVQRKTSDSNGSIFTRGRRILEVLEACSVITVSETE